MNDKESMNDKNKLIQTLTLLIEQEEQLKDQPFQVDVDDEVYSRLFERTYTESRTEDSEPEIFSKDEIRKEGNMFIGDEAFNPLDPDNYMQLKVYPNREPIIIQRKTAQNIADKVQTTLLKYNLPCTPLWLEMNGKELDRVKAGIDQIKDRMHAKDKRFRVVQRKKIHDEVKPKFNQSCAIHSTNDGGINYYIFVYIYIYIYIYIYKYKYI